jgi:hypothetical protein
METMKTEPLKKKSQDLIALEEYFSDIKSKTNVKGHLTSIERILKRQFDLNFSIEIIENKTNDFFGMSIYPTRNIVDTMIDHIVNKKSKAEVLEEIWAQNKDWHLEIDSILLNDTTLNTNPAEMVAILLHEIGHIVFSNTVPVRVNKVLRYELLHLSFNLKKLVAWRKAQKLLDLVIVEACSSKNFHFMSKLQKEVDADKFVVKQGYGDNLEQFVGKLLAAQGNRIVNRTEKELENDIRSIVNWTVINISELQYRKSKLRTTLQTEILQNPSKYVRGLVYDIKSTFFGGTDEDSYREILKEQYLIEEYNNVVKEGFFDMFDKKTGKLKRLSQSDIDIIEVEMERIENQDDKLYVLDLIYNKLDTINAGLDLIQLKKNDKVPMSKDTLTRWKTELDKMRKEVLNLQIPTRDYGIVINYPKGYEG